MREAGGQAFQLRPCLHPGIGVLRAPTPPSARVATAGIEAGEIRARRFPTGGQNPRHRQEVRHRRSERRSQGRCRNGAILMEESETTVPGPQ